MNTPPDRVLLPPRPKLRDWPVAGTTAGLFLGTAECAIAAATGATLAPPVALGVVATAAVLVGTASLAVGIALQLLEIRLSHSGLVGAVIGPLLFCSVASAPGSWLAAGAVPNVLQLLALLGAGAAAAVAGLATTRLTSWLERSGRPASGPLVWAAVAVSLACAERVFHPTAAPTPRAALGAGVVLPGIALFAVAGFARAAGRTAAFPRSFGRVLALAALLGGGVVFAPWVIPWLPLDRELPSLGSGPPNLLLAALPAASDARDPAPAVDLLASAGIRYDRFLPERPGGVDALLRLPDGAPLLPRMTAAGYATAVILTEPLALPGIDAAEVDSRPGPGQMLRDAAAWTAGAPILMGLGSAFLPSLGLSAGPRSAAQLAADARRWLVGWRTERAPAPFFLFLDFRGKEATGVLANADAVLGELIAQLDHLEIADHTLVLVALEQAAVDRVSEGASLRRVVVRPPPPWRPPSPGFRAEDGVLGSDLAAALLAATGGDEETPMQLPGVPQREGPELSPRISRTTPSRSR